MIGFSFVAAIFLGFQVLAGDGNGVGTLMLYLGIFGFLIGAINPHAGFYTLVLFCGYSDLVKRLMMFDDRVTQVDLIAALSGAPLCFAGIFLSVFLNKLVHRKFDRHDTTLLLFGIAMSAYAVISQLSDGFAFGDLRGLVDLGEFGFVPFALYNVFRERERLWRWLRFLLIVFCPVVFYAFWQRYVGLSGFEYDYLLSGLTLEARQLDDATGKIRPFSTLNAASSLSIVCPILAMIAISGWRGKALGFWGMIAFVLIYTAGTYVTFTRTGWLSFAIALGMSVFMQLPKGIYVAVVAGMVGLAAIIAGSEFLYDRLPDWQSEVTQVVQSNDADVVQTVRIGTLTDRFIGFVNVKNFENWKPFGLNESELAGLARNQHGTPTHDMFSESLFGHGFVPLAVVFAVFMTAVHLLAQRIRQLPAHRRFSACVALGGASGMLSSMLSSNYLLQYPANILWIVMIGIVAWEAMNVPEEQRKRVVQRTGSGRVPVRLATPSI